MSTTTLFYQVKEALSKTQNACVISVPTILAWKTNCKSTGQHIMSKEHKEIVLLGSMMCGDLSELFIVAVNNRASWVATTLNPFANIEVISNTDVTVFYVTLK